MLSVPSQCTYLQASGEQSRSSLQMTRPRLARNCTIIVVGLFVCAASTVVWLVLKYTVGIRVEEEAEINGLDMEELGMEAYPEFKAV